jgi:hypothetical protein
MTPDEKINYIKQIGTHLGTKWVYIPHEDTGWSGWLTDGTITLWFNFDDWKKKLNISADPGDRRNAVDYHLRHNILRDSIRLGERDARTLSMGVSWKDAEKVAKDITRRLLPDSYTMATRVQQIITERNITEINLFERVKHFKDLLGDIPMREDRGNENTKTYAWKARFLEAVTHHEFGEIEIRLDTCNISLNGTSLERAAELFKSVMNGKDLIA